MGVDYCQCELCRRTSPDCSVSFHNCSNCQTIICESCYNDHENETPLMIYEEGGSIINGDEAIRCCYCSTYKGERLYISRTWLLQWLLDQCELTRDEAQKQCWNEVRKSLRKLPSKKGGKKKTKPARKSQKKVVGVKRTVRQAELANEEPKRPAFSDSDDDYS